MPIIYMLSAKGKPLMLIYTCGIRTRQHVRHIRHLFLQLMLTLELKNMLGRTLAILLTLENRSVNEFDRRYLVEAVHEDYK